MWHWSVVSSEDIRLSIRLFLICTAIAIATIASASEELTQRSCHPPGDPACRIQPALSDLVQENVHSDRYTYFANPGEEELLFPAWRSSHEEHAAAGDATRGYLAGYAREAQAMHTINHHIDHQAALPLIYKEVQEPSSSFQNHFQGNKFMAHDSLEAFNAISASDRLEEGSSGNFLEVSDYMAAGLVDDTFVNFDFVKFDDYLNPEEGIPPFSDHSSVQELDSEHFLNTEYIRFGPKKSSVLPATERHARSPPPASQRNQVSGNSYLAGYPHIAQRMHTVNQIYKETQEPLRSFHNHLPGNNYMANDSLEAISAKDQFEEFSVGNPLAVTDYLAAGLIDDTVLNLHGHVNPEEAISPFSGYSSVQEWDLQDFPNPKYVQSDTTKSTVTPAQGRHTTSLSSYQGNQAKVRERRERAFNQKLYRIAKVLPGFLNFVEMILAIIPWSEGQLGINQEKKLDLFKELNKAAQFFKEFVTYVMGPASVEVNNTDWKAKKYYILHTRGKRKFNYTLWCALEL
ncbi:hypothetical protein PSTG_04030 [Puccinia striiformis f. sp. tritici PST-78]|uniref:Uncharacterized protein n=1 Tax=Puccinia striiformis f. sp. tritici PST-78 TaxID=1165861 RepID=A0A0L0VUQ5_9BASI|nr:hypothetical protein PSTG_04030 [Puccinia striiformis f. sp. tritici PST-78]